MIHHVTREVPPAALEECVAFYAILSFKEVQPPPGIVGRAVWLERGTPPQQVHLMPKPEAAPAPGHFALVCSDYEPTVDALRQAGHEVDPRREHWGSPRCYVRDPAGNLVELMEWPPGGR